MYDLNICIYQISLVHVLARRANVCVLTWTYIYKYIYVHTLYMYNHTCIWWYIHMYMCIYVYTFDRYLNIYIGISDRFGTRWQDARIYMCLVMSLCLYIYLHMHAHMIYIIHTYTLKYLHKCMYWINRLMNLVSMLAQCANL